MFTQLYFEVFRYNVSLRNYHDQKIDFEILRFQEDDNINNILDFCDIINKEGFLTNILIDMEDNVIGVQVIKN